MPRQSIDEFLDQRKTVVKQPKASAHARPGFDAATYQAALQTNDTSAASPERSGGFMQGTKNFLGGAIDSFAAPGRTIQKMLPKALGTIGGERAADTIEERFNGNVDPNAFSTKAGQFTGEVASFATPGGASMKLPQLAYRGATGAGIQALREGEVNTSVGVAGGVAAFAPPVISESVKGASRLVSNVIKNAAAGISGKGSKVIETIYNNPTAAREGLNEVVSLADDAVKIRQSVSGLARAASDEFAADLANLPKRLGRTPQVLNAGQKTTIKTGGKTYTLSLQGVKSNLTKELRKFDVEVDPKGKTFNFLEAPLDNAESKRLQEVFSIIDTWKDTSPVGFHKLARKIASFRRPGEQSPELNAIIDSVSRNTRGYIGKRIPAAKEMLTKYSDAQDIIDALDQEFATKGRFIGGTADQIKTERKLATAFSGEKDTAHKILDENVDSNIIARQAGRELGQGITRSGASIGDLLRTAVNTVISPKLIGEVTIKTGLAGPQAQRLLQAIQSADPALRGVLVQMFSDVFENSGPTQ